ncbi:MAG: Oligopeptide transport ATP-binding protein OppF [Candidatus Carbobacillus altaicus]|uniref:Oligopeptide transport ATP-binding protein OppF n=1 Tax=Candidatus Carbonibacillus altaicus TaxID=2163959 RepID=A0A2R6Y3Z0_9BACL|nr:MAG: Oligopeptide transport ATP-binding protein OppF [Candidatus Carbobacillus altaicus]
MEPVIERMLEVQNLKKYFSVGKQLLKAIDDVSLEVKTGQSVGIVGESGSGKSTFARLVLGLLEATDGNVFFMESIAVQPMKKNNRSMTLRKYAQIVFQNPYLSLFPHLTIGANIEEPLRIHGVRDKEKRHLRAQELMYKVGVPEAYYDAFPHELSGGQQQRVAIARALALNPKLIVFDEPVSSLDVSIQAQILNLLLDLKEQYRLTYVFIAHDLAVVEYISDVIAVMYLGRFVEYAPKRFLIDQPLHPYTNVLLESVPVVGGSLKDVAGRGEIPSPLSPPSGCPFHPRCTKAFDRCRLERPEFIEVKPNHWVACHLYT